MAETLGADVQVWLFGSRLEDDKLGGDVDLLVEGPVRIDLHELLKAQVKLESVLGTPVDLVRHRLGDTKQPIVDIAHQTGLRLS